ncbi:MAG: GTPase ObgE [Fimbriimonadaceae bacterium]|nr:GTPase ObgE [Fimbriimonadaceae bacterium]QYK54879.1 MAG: GTPase ObgE [Fimbriimonadaceae bacterium]
MSGFIDEAVVTFESGRGGNGAASFHREKHVPRGGPNGADGGKGGDIILKAERGMRTLYEFKLKDHYRADHGTHAVNNKAGKNGKSITVRVPIGTQVTEVGDEEPLVDLVAHGMSFVVARGGRGGRGNLHYTSSVRQAPTFAEKGAPGEAVQVKLEMKLLADVGLVGLPNAGKSTLISACSAAKPKIGAYPFTTIVPNLGVVSVGDETFVMADMPGLIEGASEGVGLGHQFLKHVERTRVLIHVVDLFPIDETDPFTNYKTVEHELQRYSPALAERPRLLVLNKTDLGTPEMVEAAAEPFRGIEVETFLASAATNQGLEPMLFRALALLKESEGEQPEVVLRPVAVERTPGDWGVLVENGEYIVTGKRIERLVAMTNLGNSEAVRYLHRKLERIGVVQKLRDMGIEENDTVKIGNYEFAFMDW